jgi:predicted phosphodiesterase
MTHKFILILIILIGHFISTSIPAINSISELDEIAAFSFAVVSDHKGYSPLDHDQMAKADKWIKQGNNRFIVGLGDHIFRDKANTFIEFIGTSGDTFWHNNFYPLAADGENSYYGGSQAAYGKGGRFFDEVDLSLRPNVQIQPNYCDYYATVNVKDFTVHLIQLYFSDRPQDPRVSFSEETRSFMMKTLESINKTDKDIIVVSAHSMNGEWVSLLTEERREKLLNKADLVFSATNHRTRRYTYSRDSGAICLNTGSVGYALDNYPNGYMEIHVLANPTRIITQYHRTDAESTRMLAVFPYAFIKDEKNKISNVNWNSIQGATETKQPSYPGKKISEHRLEVFPNPFSKILGISLVSPELGVVSKEAHVQIYSIHGILVHQTRWLTAQNSQLTAGYNWHATGHPSGIYLIKAQSGDQVISKRVILNK